MEDGIVMYSTLTCQYFYLRKLDAGERRSEPVPQLSDEEGKKLLQESYVEISVYPGFGSDSEKILPQLYLLNDGRVILYAMGKYFLLRQN